MKRFVSWEEIDRNVEILCQQIVKSGKQIKSITGVQRGGLIPAVMISHKLGIPYVSRITPYTLVVDDICDTGKTLGNSVAIITAALHFKPSAKFQPAFYAEEVGTEWIVYPWERNDSEAIQDYLKK
jgi:hypoxanthine phosphoribosyltransferase